MFNPANVLVVFLQSTQEVAEISHREGSELEEWPPREDAAVEDRRDVLEREREGGRGDPSQLQ